MVIERADYPTLDKKEVLTKLVTLSEHLEDLLRDYWRAGGAWNAKFATETNSDGIQLFWVDPPLAVERPATAWSISAQGCKVSKGTMTKAVE